MGNADQGGVPADAVALKGLAMVTILFWSL
jgi:hypothetical protein